MADNHPKYSSQDGVLFDKNKTTLLRYPGGKCGESYTVPKSVKTIQAWAFARTYLKELNLPDGLETIETYAFYLTEIGSSLKIPENILSIAPYAFSSAEILKVVLPNSLKRIEDYTFYRSQISAVDFPKNLQYIGEGAFAGDKKLGTITIKSKKLTSVGKNAFKGIKSTARIKVPASKLEKYKKLLKGKGQGSKVKIVK